MSKKYVDEAALSLCAGLSEGSAVPCIHIIEGKKFQRDALRICESLPMTSSKFDCLRAIANKTYSRQDIEICDRESLIPLTLECLSGY